MMLTKHIPPRRLILACLVLSGLAVRLWGLAWSPAGAASLLLGEWGWQVIEHLGLSQPTYPGLWTQAFFSLAALVQGLASLAAGLLELVLAQARALAEVRMSGLLAGRLCVAVLGAAQIPLVYLIGRRSFDSVATGLLAAVLVAFSPLLVTRGHYLALDVPLGFMVLLCAWLAWLVMESPRAGLFFGLGLVLGLTITTAPAGLAAAPLVLAATLLALGQARKVGLRWLLLWPLYGAAGLLLGLVLGSPALLLHWNDLTSLEPSRLGLPSMGQDWWSLALQRGRQAAGFWLGVQGLEVALLWLLGVVILVVRRQGRRCLIALTPLPFMLAGLLLPGGSPAGGLAVWLPAAAVVACWPLVLLCRRLPRYKMQVAAVVLLALALGVASLWRSLAVGYLFWQQGTLHSAQQWLRANLAPQDRVLAGPGVPLDIFTDTRPWGQDRQRGDILGQRQYLVVADWPDQEGKRSPVPQLPSSLQLLKRLDLKSGWGPGRWWLKDGFPARISPRVEVYAPRPASLIRQPLALARPPVGYQRPYAVVYGQSPQYSRDDGVLLLNSVAGGRRVLRLEQPLEALGLRLSNLGQELAEVEISQGPWPSQWVALYPGQSGDLTLAARRWPPMTKGIYPLGIRLKRPGRLWAQLVYQPLLLGKREMEAGRWASAVPWLEQALRQQDSFDARAMLAGGLTRLGRYEEANRALAGLPGQVAREYLALAGEPRGPQWDRRLAGLTGYHLDLLRRAVSITYQVDGPLCLSNGKEVSLRGTGYHGSYQRNKQGVGMLALWLADPYPQGPWLAEFSFSSPTRPEPQERLAEIQVWARGSPGAQLLAKAQIRGADLAQDNGRVLLPLPNPWGGARLEVRLFYTSPHRLRLHALRVGADLRAHLAWVLRWYHEAWGQVSLHTGRYQAAVDSFRALLKLAPGFREAYLPLARALMETGKLKQASQMVRRAEKAFLAFPDRLQGVAELYKLLQKPKDAVRVEARLGHLRPSLKRESRFEVGMTLLGYDLPKAQVKAGGRLDVTFYWRAWRPVPWDYVVFLHLRGPQRVLNFDHSLDHGRWAMPELKPGQVVREDLRLNIPGDAPPGNYRLVVGLWDPHFTREPLYVVHGQGEGGREVELAEVKVGKP